MVRGLWEQGAMSQPEIAAEIGATPDQVKYLISKNGWVQGARAEYYEKIALESIRQQTLEDAKKLTVQKETAREKAVQLATVVEGRLIKTIKDADAKGLSDAAVLNDYKALEIASRIIQNTMHTKRFALGMDKEEITQDEAGEIHLIEMSAEEMDEIKAAQEEAYQLTSISEE
jgi:hypothetical protein